MKKNTPSKLIAPQNDSISNPKSFTFTIKIAAFLLVLTSFCNSISAQNGNSVTPQVKELDLYLSSLKSIDQNKFNYVDNLVHGLQPSIYFYSNVIKTYGEKPNTLYTDINSMQDSGNPGLLRDNIEIVNLKIINTNDKINLSKFSNYNNLKYIYVVSKINLNDQNVINMIRNYDEKYIIFYKTLKEE